MNSKTFGQKIKEQRKKIGLTQAYVAALAHTGIRFISDLENGKETVQLEKALLIAKILSMKVTLE